MEANSEVNNNPNTMGQTLPSASSTVNSQSSNATSQSGDGSSGVGVAAAIAVNVENSNNTAEIGNGVTVTAGGGAASVALSTRRRRPPRRQGRPWTSQPAPPFAAVGLNVATINNDALIGQGSSATGQGISVQAVTPAGLTNDFIVWGLAAAGGTESDASVAGSVGVNVINYTTEANAATGTTIDSPDGGVTFNATDPMDLQNVAASGMRCSGNVGVGAAVAVNVVQKVTEAYVAASSHVEASDALSVTATSSLNPIAVTGIRS